MRTHSSQFQSSWKPTTLQARSKTFSGANYNPVSVREDGESTAQPEVAPPLEQPWGLILKNVMRQPEARAANQRQAMAGSEGLQMKPQPNIKEPKEMQTDRVLQQMPSPEQHSQNSRENKTGLPDRLKVGVENLSGLSMDEVKVHYNSAKPAQVKALAYTQGNHIHIGPGQEQHLPHEAWHVVQQKQGRVKPTIQMKGVAINDAPELESEAETMGEKALRAGVQQRQSTAQLKSTDTAIAQRKENVIQLYPALNAGNANEITEERYATGNGAISFGNFDSCLGIVGRNGTNLTGIHLVYVDGNGVRLDGANDDLNQNKALTVATIASLLNAMDEVKLVGDIDGWNGTASFFMQTLRAAVNNIADGQNSPRGEWTVTYDAHNGWSYINLG